MLASSREVELLGVHVICCLVVFLVADLLFRSTQESMLFPVIALETSRDIIRLLF